MMEFDGNFELWSFSRSHSILTFRHSEIRNGAIQNNDIVFIGTYYLEIPDSLRNPIIYEGGLEDQEIMAKKNKGVELIWEFNKVFVIECRDAKYYVGAGKIQFGKSQGD